MFKRKEDEIKNLKQENLAVYEENKQNRRDIEELEIKKYHAKILVEDTLKQLDEIQEILNTGLEEHVKKQNINIIVNNLRQKNIDIKNELAKTAIQD